MTGRGGPAVPDEVSGASPLEDPEWSGARPSRPRPLAVAAVVGAIWGLAGYAILWGHTSVVLHRPFVVSALGTVLLLPIRVVLWGIRWVEEGLGRAPFDFSANNAWIGVLAGLVGAGIAGGVTLAAAAVVQAVRRSSQTADRP